MSNNFRMRGRLRAVICCCRPVPEGVRLMESIRRMDVNILMAFLHTSASANSNENILLCCKILEHRKKLTLQQELTIVHCMYTTITQREVTMSNMLVTADTLDSILTDSIVPSWSAAAMETSSDAIEWLTGQMALSKYLKNVAQDD
ncbi:uncharacterized protein LOC144820256 [Lissotriton helveticus]